MMMQKELTSTQKLLDYIRSDGPATSGSADPQPPTEAAPKKPSGRKFRSPFRYFTPWRARCAVGVDIGRNAIRLVKMTAGAEENRRLLDYKTVAIPPGTTVDGSDTANLLAGALREFCGPGGKPEIWTSISAANVEVRSLLIPKVPLRQLPNTIYWLAKKEGVSLDEREEIFDYQIHHEEIYHDGQPRYSVTIYTAPRKEIEEKRQLFTRAGWPLTGVTIVPFAIQNLLGTGRIQPREETVACLFIGNDFSRIDIFFQGTLLMTRGIKAGVESFVEALVDGYRDKFSAGPQGHEDNRVPQLEGNHARSILKNFFSANDPMAGLSVEYNLKEQDVLSLIIPATGRIIRQVERTFEHFTASKGRSRVQRLYCSSVMGTTEHFLNYFKEQFVGVEIEQFDFPLSGRDRVGFDETGAAERIPYTTALGLALAGNSHTPNAIFTYRDKTALESTARVNRLIFASFLVSVAVCSVIFIYLDRTLAETRATKAALEREIQGFHPPLDAHFINRQLAELQGKSQRLKAYSRRHLDLATIGELSNLTPPGIRLLSITANFEHPGANPSKGLEKTQPGNARVILEGIVGEASRPAEARLAEYVLALDQSPLFSQASVEKSSPEMLGRNKALHFNITMKIE